MGEIRQSGEYAVFKENIYRFESLGLLLWGNRQEFKINSSLDLLSVYKLETWAEVDGFPMRIWNILSVNIQWSLQRRQWQYILELILCLINTKVAIVLC